MKKTKSTSSQEFSIFEVGELTCAISIEYIQEINKQLEITGVYNAPEYVRGILNLRGQIITVIDLGAKFGFEQRPLNEDMRIIVVNYQDEKIGFLVDAIVDVVSVEPDCLEPPPSNISGIAGEYFSSIYKMEDSLAAVLNIDEILKPEKDSASHAGSFSQ